MRDFTTCTLRDLLVNLFSLTFALTWDDNISPFEARDARHERGQYLRELDRRGYRRRRIDTLSEYYA